VTELTSSGGLVGNFAPSGANFNDPSSVAIDALGNLWVPNFDGNRGPQNEFAQIAFSTIRQTHAQGAPSLGRYPQNPVEFQENGQSLGTVVICLFSPLGFAQA